MAEKKTISTLAAKAVARVKGQPQFSGAWRTGAHLAFIRYMALDAIATAERSPELGKPIVDGKPEKHTVASLVDRQLKAALAEDVEIAYASNFEKLLVRVGEIQKANAEFE